MAYVLNFLDFHTGTRILIKHSTFLGKKVI